MKRIGLLLYRICFPLVLTAIFLILIPRLLLFFLPFFLGAILAVLASPIIHFVSKTFPGIKKEHWTVLIIVFLFVLVLGLLYLLFLLGGPFLSVKMAGFPEYLLSAKNMVLDSLEKVRQLLPEGFQEIFANMPKKMEGYGKNILRSWSSPAIRLSLHLVGGLPELVLYFVIMILSSFSFVKEGSGILQGLQKIVPESFSRYGKLLREDGKKIIKGYILAQIEIMFCVFLLLAIGFSFLRVPYGVLLAFLTAFLDALPIFGVGFIMWPWMLFILIQGRFGFFAVLLVLYLLTQVIRQFLQPKIIGEAIGLPPLLALLFLFLGYKFYGLSGMVLALPVGMLLLRFYHYGAYDGLILASKELKEILVKALYQ